MKKNNRKYLLIFAAILIAISFGSYFKNRAQIEISQIGWSEINGKYSVSFSAKNRTRNSLSANLSINLLQRNFAGGSPKAETLKTVGEKQIAIDLAPGQIKEFKEVILPKTFSFKPDAVTINPWGITETDT